MKELSEKEAMELVAPSLSYMACDLSKKLTVAFLANFDKTTQGMERCEAAAVGARGVADFAGTALGVLMYRYKGISQSLPKLIEMIRESAITSFKEMRSLEEDYPDFEDKI